MSEISYDIEPYLAKVDFTEGELDRLCVKKAEVIGVQSRQTVKILCEGVEYNDVPVWVHTDCGARHWYMKGIEAERDGLEKPTALTAEEYFNDAALLLPFPGGQEIYEMPSGPTRITVAPNVLAIFSKNENNEDVAVAIINVLSSVIFYSETEDAFRTYRPYLYFKIISKRWESTTSLNLVDVTGIREKFFLADLLTNSSAKIPTTYDAGVPKGPLVEAEMLDSSATSVVTEFLSFDRSFKQDVLSKPENVTKKRIGDIHGEWARSGVTLGVNGVCYHPDGSWSYGWSIIDGIYTSACTGSTVIYPEDTWNGEQIETIVRATFDGIGKGLGGGGGEDETLSDQDIYGGEWEFSDGFKLEINYEKQRVKTTESVPFSPARLMPQTIHYNDYRTGTQTFTLRYTPSGSDVEEVIDLEYAGEQNFDIYQETNGSVPLTQNENGVLLHISDVLAYFSISPLSNFYLSGFGFGVGSIVFENSYTSEYNQDTTRYDEEITDVDVSATGAISVIQHSNESIVGTGNDLFSHILAMAKNMADEDDWETVTNPEVNRYSSVLRRTYKYGVEFIGLYFVPFDRRIELLKEENPA